MLLPFLVCMWSTPLAKLHSPRQCCQRGGRAVNTLRQWERRILSRRPRTLERRIAKALANCYTSCVSRLDCSEIRLPLELAGDIHVCALFALQFDEPNRVGTSPEGGNCMYADTPRL